MGDRAYILHPVLTFLRPSAPEKSALALASSVIPDGGFSVAASPPATGKLSASGGEGERLRPPEACLEEAVGLAHAIALDVRGAEVIRVSKPHPGTLVGGGTIERLQQTLEDEEVKLVVIDHTLSPVQQRNLEKAWGVKVIDRTGLILEIFGARARTREGMLQVELAALTYQRSRLVRAWTHLERQRGGFGFMGGPGETQIELDRRMLDEKIIRLKADLEKVRRTRDIQRKSRERVPFPVVALVGYTNAGKSTLFNALTGASVFAEDLLFATLDPTMRGLTLPSGTKIILSDTVGFISDLPTHLVAAFRATLEEVQLADAILHVRDISKPWSEAERQDVHRVLQDLGIDPLHDERLFEVHNKIDLLPADERQAALNRAARAEKTIAVSAVSGEGLPELAKKIDLFVTRDNAHLQLSLDMGRGGGKALSWIYDHGTVTARDDREDGTLIRAHMPQKALAQFRALFPEEAAGLKESVEDKNNNNKAEPA